MELPKILIAAPTAAAKSYCFEQWLDNVMNFKYPNFQVRLFDNTLNDGGAFVKQMNDYYKSKYGDNDTFLAIKSDVTTKQDIKERMYISSEEMRLYAINNGFDYLFSLESDVFPELSAIEDLLYFKKDIAGCVYYRDSGHSRRPMIQTRIFRSAFNIVTDNATPLFDCSLTGELTAFAHIGLGAVLISKKILSEVPFRHIPNNPKHCDSLWAEDIYNKYGSKIKIWCLTSSVAKHLNQDWASEVYAKERKV